MYKVKDFYTFLNKAFPFKKAQKWDTVGLIFGNLNSQVTGVSICLDLNKEFLINTIESKNNLIITHHPFLFEKTLKEELIKSPYKKELIKLIKKHKINIISCHTNYDISSVGTKTQVGKILNLDEKKFKKTNFGIIAQTDQTLKNILTKLKKELNIQNFELNFEFKDNNKFQKIGFLPGSGAIEDIIAIHKKGAEVIFTSDIKWSYWITFNELDIKVVNLSHQIENVFVFHIYDFLINKFVNLNFKKEILNSPNKFITI